MKKLFFFIILLLCNLQWYILNTKAAPQNPIVVVEKVRKEYISDSFLIVGRVAALESDTVSVKTFGPVEEVYAKVGDQINKGDILLKIETDELLEDKVNKEGELSESLARLELEEKKLERLKALMQSPSFKMAEYEDQINIVKAAEGNLIKITSQYNKAKIAYDDAKFKAPYSGVISKRLVTKGKYVNIGDPVFEIINKEKYELEANVPLDKMEYLDRKKNIEIILSDNQILQTSIKSFIPKENPDTRTVLVRLLPLFDIKKANLIINQNINLKMYLKSKNKVKTINKDAILIKDNKYVVYLIENNIAKIKPIITGKSYKNYIEIIDGLKVGDVVVTRGNERLTPNQKVQIEGK